MSEIHDLSGIRYTGNQNHKKDHVAIIVSKWNDRVTSALFKGALDTLIAAGIPAKNIIKYAVPGSFELPMGAQMALTKSEETELAGIICLGCVVQGETRHFDFICQSCADGVMRVGLDFDLPVIFGVLTTENEQQALDRAGGKLGNKGAESAVALLEMIDLHRL